MSEEQLKAFLEAVKADAGLQEKLKSVTNADAVVEIAKAAGFSISIHDWSKAQSDIEDAELEAAAGGSNPDDWFQMPLPKDQIDSLSCYRDRWS